MKPFNITTSVFQQELDFGLLDLNGKEEFDPKKNKKLLETFSFKTSNIFLAPLT